MTPELWVTLAVGLAAPIGTVIVAWMNRGRRSVAPTREPEPTGSDE